MPAEFDDQAFFRDVVSILCSLKHSCEYLETAIRDRLDNSPPRPRPPRLSLLLGGEFSAVGGDENA